MVTPRWPNDSMTSSSAVMVGSVTTGRGRFETAPRGFPAPWPPLPLFLFGLLLLVLILFCVKIETKIKISTFKELNSGVLNICTMLCGPHHYLAQKFSSLLMETPYLLSNAIAPYSPSPWDPCLSVFYPMDLHILDIVCKWNHSTVYDVL